MALLAVADLSVSFRTPGGVLTAVRGMSFDVQAGETVAIVGESGSGKSAALLAILGLLPSNGHAAGSVRFGGQELLTAGAAALGRVRGRQIGMVFQDASGSLNPTMTVGAQVAEVAARHLDLGPRAALAYARAVLGAVGLEPPRRRAGEYPGRWSGGMRRRAALAIALAGRPRLLLADEPTAGLDATVARAVLDRLDRLRSEAGMAAVLVSHDLGVVASVADRVLIAYAGRIVEQGSVGDIFARAAHPYTAALLGALPGRGVLRPIPGGTPDPRYLGPGCAFAARCHQAVRGCALAEPAAYPAPGEDGHSARCWLWHPDAPAPLRPGRGGGHVGP